MRGPTSRRKGPTCLFSPVGEQKRKRRSFEASLVIGLRALRCCAGPSDMCNGWCLRKANSASVRQARSTRKPYNGAARACADDWTSEHATARWRTTANDREGRLLSWRLAMGAVRLAIGRGRHSAACVTHSGQSAEGSPPDVSAQALRM